MTFRPTRVTVLLPAHDAESTIEVALASVARQTLEDFEAVVVVDGGTDATLARAQAFAKEDTRFRVIATEHGGIVAALQRAIAEAQSPVLARMDADDLMHRDRLRKQLDRLDADPGLSGVGCHVRLFPRSTLREGRRAYEVWINSITSPQDVARERFVECPIAHPTLTLRAQALRAVGGYHDTAWAEDYDLVSRLLDAGHRLAVIPQRHHSWRDHPGRLSRRDPRYAIERFTDARAHYLARTFLADAAGYALCGFGGTGRSLRRALEREGKTMKLLVELHPGRIGKTIHGALVIHPRDLHASVGMPIIASVAGVGPRTEVREMLTSKGFEDGVDFVCAA